MKTKKYILVLSLLSTIMLSSCIDKILGHKYVDTIENCEIGFKHSYSINGLFDHSPKSISYKSFIDQIYIQALLYNGISIMIHYFYFLNMNILAEILN